MELPSSVAPFLQQEARMTDPDNKRPSERDDTALFMLIGILALIVVGGLVYGLSHPSIYASNPPQTVGSAAAHARSGHPM
jgi:hypothetical protein